MCIPVYKYGTSVAKFSTKLTFQFCTRFRNTGTIPQEIVRARKGVDIHVQSELTGRGPADGPVIQTPPPTIQAV